VLDWATDRLVRIVGALVGDAEYDEERGLEPL
jgi:hypothetical protein